MQTVILNCNTIFVLLYFWSNKFKKGFQKNKKKFTDHKLLKGRVILTNI